MTVVQVLTRSSRMDRAEIVASGAAAANAGARPIAIQSRRVIAYWIALAPYCANAFFRSLAIASEFRPSIWNRCIM